MLRKLRRIRISLAAEDQQGAMPNKTLTEGQGKKGSSDLHALACEEQGNGRRGGGGRGKSGRGRGGRRSNGDGKMESATCWRCRQKGHYSNDCTTKLCERCGGRGHEEDKCPSPADMQANLAVELQGADSESTTSSVEAAAF